MTHQSESAVRGRLRTVGNLLNSARLAFRRWRHRRPFWGGLLLMLSGLQIFASTQLDLGALQLRIGLEGMLSVVIPIIVGLAGLLIWFMPAHRVFYGVIGLVVALFSLIGVNLGGFFIGMLLGILGGSFAIAWVPRDEDAAAESPDEAERSDEEPPDDDELPEGESSDDIVELESLLEDEYPPPPPPRRYSSEPAAEPATLPEPGQRPEPVQRGGESGQASVQLVIVGVAVVALVAATWLVPAMARQQAPVAADPSACVDDDSPAEIRGQAAVASGGVIDDLLDGLLRDGDDSADDPTSGPTPTSSPSPTSTSDPTPTPTPTSSPTPTPTPTATPTPTPSPTDEPCEPPDKDPPPEEDPPPDGDEDDDAGDSDSEWPIGEEDWPEGAVPTEKRDATPSFPDGTVVGDPSRLRADRLTMKGLIYEGNVCLPQVDGECIESLWFTMDEAHLENFIGDAPSLDGTITTLTSPDVTFAGDINFYTPRFVGWMLGFKWTFLPETPPPFTLPLMIFDDVDIQVSLNISNTLDAGSMILK